MKGYLHILSIVVAVLFASHLAGCSNCADTGGPAATPSPPPSAKPTPAPKAGVLFVTKTAVTSTGGGPIEITFIFGPRAVPKGMAPTVGVTSKADADVSIGNCKFNPDRTAFTCIVSNVNGCATLTDYSVRLSGKGFADLLTTFNSADDEFDWPNSQRDNMFGDGKCWRRGTHHLVTEEVTKGALKMGFPKVGVGHDLIFKQFGGDFAFSSYITANRPPKNGYANVWVRMANVADNKGLSFVNGRFFTGDDTWLIGVSGRLKDIFAQPSGSLEATAKHTAPFRVCLVRHKGRIKIYVSTKEDAPYTWLTRDNLSCYAKEGDCHNVQNDVLNLDVGSWNKTNVFLMADKAAEAPYEVRFAYARFKATGLTGTSADCPAIP